MIPNNEKVEKYTLLGYTSIMSNDRYEFAYEKGGSLAGVLPFFFLAGVLKAYGTDGVMGVD
jgi:hypothetical protein